jgi:hypothetical protein
MVYQCCQHRQSKPQNTTFPAEIVGREVHAKASLISPAQNVAQELARKYTQP